jgi:hypothetical protein
MARAELHAMLHTFEGKTQQRSHIYKSCRCMARYGYFSKHTEVAKVVLEGSTACCPLEDDVCCSNFVPPDTGKCGANVVPSISAV